MKLINITYQFEEEPEKKITDLLQSVQKSEYRLRQTVQLLQEKVSEQNSEIELLKTHNNYIAKVMNQKWAKFCVGVAIGLVVGFVVCYLTTTGTGNISRVFEIQLK